MIELSVIVNILKLHAHNIFCKKIMLETEIKCLECRKFILIIKSIVYEAFLYIHLNPDFLRALYPFNE